MRTYMVSETCSRTVSSSPALGVRPPSSRPVQSSSRRAPPSTAARAPATKSTHASTMTPGTWIKARQTPNRSWRPAVSRRDSPKTRTRPVRSPRLIPPTHRVHVLRMPLPDFPQDSRNEHLMVPEPRRRVRPGVVPVPAVLRPGPVIHLRLRRRIRRLEELLHQVHCIVQVVVVRLSNTQVELPADLGAQRLPLPPQDPREVEVLLPVVRHLMVYPAGFLVEDPSRISIRTSGRIHGLPDVPLIARPGLRAERELAVVHLLQRAGDVSQVVP